MQSKSIHNPAPIENAQAKNLSPISGDNFTTVTCLDHVTDPMALLQAIDILNDYAIALEAFEQELQCTGTPKTL